MSTIYSVTQLNNEIKNMLESNPSFRNIFVGGEISNFKLHTSGHLYFTLKDADAAISAVMFRSDAARLKFRPENGVKVIARGRISSFPKSGQVQLYAADLVPDGAGALSLAFEQLKKRLESEGLFDERYKKEIPAMPSNIAIVTSPTGAAVRDMIRILNRRWPLAKVVLYPALVQGEGAAESIASAIMLANAVGESDVILCGRGGGSIEDLWAFNEEITARAIFDSEIPVISAVGHEPDVTIADFVADLRAPTPSGAAELAVPDKAEYQQMIFALRDRLRLAAKKSIAERARHKKTLEERLFVRTPAKYIDEKRVGLDVVCERLYGAMPRLIAKEKQNLGIKSQRLSASAKQLLQKKRMKFTQSISALDAMSPLKVLARGYSLVENENGIITNAEKLTENDSVHVQFGKGSADCTVTKVWKEKSENGRKNI